MTSVTAERRNPALRTLTTPEGVPIAITSADRGTRGAAFLIGILIVGFTVAAVFVIFGLTLSPSGGGLWIASGVLVFTFLVRPGGVAPHRANG